MDWKLLFSTFAAVFLAELGDKTQLATLSFSAAATSKWTVFLGSALALCAASALAVVAGGLVSRLVSPLWLRRAAGLVFVVLGAIFLITRGD